MSSSSASERREPAPPPSPAAYIACVLEISMLACFAGHHSIHGALVWLAYFHFSATRALLGGLFIR